VADVGRQIIPAQWTRQAPLNDYATLPTLVGQKRSVIHSRHPHVDDVEAAGLAGRQCRFAAEGRLHLLSIKSCVHQTPDAVETFASIVHKQGAFHAAATFVAFSGPKDALGKIVAMPRLCSLHLRYDRAA